ncbi:hypothetical protein MNBD_PLANCTO02-3085 [hydrothermal vent metagenome]|uniref:Uncharacterized protein n=1 Tax=hydrothermal vent metagenome TaxID=652676 RepID=A0A3B1DAN9_9ZZZZ
MQAPAIFLIAVTLLFASMWSSDSNYTDKNAVKLATETAMIEGNVAYRNSIPVQSKTLRLNQVDKHASFEKVENDNFVISSQKLTMSNEISVPVLNRKKLVFSNSIYFSKRLLFDGKVNQIKLADDHLSRSTRK